MISIKDAIHHVQDQNHIGSVREDPFLSRRPVTAYVEMGESSALRLVMTEARMDLDALLTVEEMKGYGNVKEETLRQLLSVSSAAMAKEKLMKLVMTD